MSYAKLFTWTIWQLVILKVTFDKQSHVDNLSELKINWKVKAKPMLWITNNIVIVDISKF